MYEEFINVYETLDLITEPVERPDYGNAWLLSNEMGCGSGVPVSCKPIGDGIYEVLFLSALHVTSTSVEFEVSNRDNTQVFLGLPHSSHPTLDLATLVCYSSVPIDTVDISLSVPAYGDQLFATGYAACQGPWTTIGYASTPGKASFGAFGGCSGGPVMNKEGQLVGVIEAVLGNGFHSVTFASFYVPLSDATDWLVVVLE